MSFPVEHHYRFDAAGKVDADDWLLLPRAQIPPAFVLAPALADEMASSYFRAAQETSPLPIRIEQDARGVRYTAPFGKTALVFAAPERITEQGRVEISWSITGGFLLAHGVSYGGRFYLGAEWKSDDTLKLYSAIRRYPPRLINWFGVSRGIAVYQQTQGKLHKQVGERFLNEIAAHIIPRVG
jgi:hypothetical protein